MNRLDDKIRAAFQALEDAVPEGYFDDFASRVDARLEGEAMNQTEVSNMNGDNEHDVPPHVAAPGSEIEAKPADTWEDDEHSGLAEITELASKTKSRISRRATTQTESEEAMLLSASHSGLSAVVLPEPGKGKQKFDDADEGETKTAAAAVATSAAVEERSGIPVWVYGAVGLVAAAAVVFFFIRGGGKTDKKVAGNEPGAAKKKSETTPPAAGGTAPDQPQPKSPSAADDKDDDKVAANAAKSDDTAPAGAKETDGDTTDDASGDNADDKPADNADDNTKADNAPTKVASNTPRRRVARRTNRRPRKAAKRTAKKNRATTTKPKPKKTRTGNKKKKDQSVEELLGQFGEKDKKKVTKKKVVKKPTKKRLSRSDIKRAMGSISGRVQGCYNKHQKAGLVMISVRVTPQAKVSATATGSFAGTPTGNCVAAAVRAAHFPKFSGRPMSFPYPFRLNP